MGRSLLCVRFSSSSIQRWDVDYVLNWAGGSLREISQTELVMDIIGQSPLPMDQIGIARRRRGGRGLKVLN